MQNDYTVKISYRNKEKEVVNERTYGLVNYCQQMKIGIMKTIADIENAFYEMQGNKSKEDWNDDTMTKFQHIRHKLLDSANNIERLPNNLYVDGKHIASVDASKYLASVLETIKN